MKRISFKKSYSMRASWMVTYIVVLSLTLVSSLISYRVLSSHLYEQITQRNSVVLESIQTTIDEQLRTIDNSTFDIASDKDVRDLIETVDLPLDSYEKFQIRNFVTDLKYMKAWGNIENFADSFWIYFPRLNQVMKQDTSHDLRDFYDTYMTEGEFSYEQWEKLINSQYNGEYRIADIFGQEEELFYIKTLFPTAGRETFINVMFRIDKEQMMKISKRLYLQEYGYFVVLDQNNQIMLQLAPIQNEFGNSSSVLEVLYNKNSCVFEKSSEINSWRYLYILPKHIAFKSINDSRAIVFLIVFICILMGLALILYFIRLHYKPVRKILSFFQSESGGRDNEYSFLERQISSVLTKSAEFEQAVDKQNSLLQTYLLNTLLMEQKLTEEPLRTEFEYLNFNSENGSFIAFIIYTKTEELAKNPQQERTYRHFVICNIVNELLTNLGYIFHYIEKNNAIVYIVQCPEAPKENELLEAVEFAFEVIRAEVGFEFFCAFGDEHSGLSGIPVSYSEARRVLEYCISKKKTGYATYQEAAAILSMSHFYSLEQEDKLLNMLKANDQTGLQREIQEIFRINIQDKASSAHAVRNLVLDLFNTVKKALIQDGRTVDKEFPEEARYIDNLSDHSDLAQMEKIIQSIFCSCATKLSGQDPTEDIVESIISYIKKNYTNQNLSITMIADQFSMNHNYISRKFKEATGLRIGDYINNIRVEQSKALLRNFDNLILHIAEQVGFSSYRTYVRVFTNVTGVTPKKFRDMQQQ